MRRLLDISTGRTSSILKHFTLFHPIDKLGGILYVPGTMLGIDGHGTLVSLKFSLLGGGRQALSTQTRTMSGDNKGEQRGHSGEIEWTGEVSLDAGEGRSGQREQQE